VDYGTYRGGYPSSAPIFAPRVMSPQWKFFVFFFGAGPGASSLGLGSVFGAIFFPLHASLLERPLFSNLSYVGSEHRYGGPWSDATAVTPENLWICKALSSLLLSFVLRVFFRSLGLRFTPPAVFYFSQKTSNNPAGFLFPPTHLC